MIGDLREIQEIGTVDRRRQAWRSGSAQVVKEEQKRKSVDLTSPPRLKRGPGPRRERRLDETNQQ